MATLTIGIVQGAQNVSRVRTFSGADLVRFVAALRAIQNVGPTGGTDDSVLLTWMDGIIADAKNCVRSAENRTATQNAISAQADIVFT